MEFDEIIEKNQYKSYGIKKGNSEILLTKTGQDAELRGYKDKYIKIATALNEKYGITVIVASNHFTGTDPLFDDLDIVLEYIRKQNFESYNIRYFGYSNGAIIGAYYGYLHPEIKEMLLVNGPIKTNLEKFVKGLTNFPRKITLVYGEKDFSYKYLPFIYPSLNSNKTLEIVPDADHHFEGLEEVFNNLPEQYLYNELDITKTSR